MKNWIKPFGFSLLIATLWLIDFAPDAPFPVVLVDSAEAVFGRPLTPVSGAGVARRTTRRAVYATSTTAAAAGAAAASDQQAQAAAQPQAAPAQAPAASSQLSAGTVVSALPTSGCQSSQVDGTTLFNCGGTVYEPKVQSGNLVYVVQ